jgi:hypothetical protein
MRCLKWDALTDEERGKLLGLCQSYVKSSDHMSAADSKVSQMFSYFQGIRFFVFWAKSALFDARRIKSYSKFLLEKYGCDAFGEAPIPYECYSFVYNPEGKIR